MTTYGPAAPTSPPTLTGGGRTGIRVVLVVAAALLIIGGLGGLTAAAVGIGGAQVIADSQPLPPTMRYLAVDTGNLPMAVRITADPDAREPRADLRFVSSAGVGKHTLEVTSDANRTRIGVVGETPEWLGWARAGQITVVLPPEQARRLSVNASQETGVLTADADIDELVVRTGDGEVFLRGAARRVEVTARDGSVTTRNPISVRESFSATSSDGNIDVDFAAPPRTIDAVTRDGDVTLGLPQRGPYLVKTQAQDWDDVMIAVDRTEDPSAAVAAVTARSANGSVTVDTRS